jgi:hypothetical protein
MPANIENAQRFLETQWSSINTNKIKGINAELRLESYLNTSVIRELDEYLIPNKYCNIKKSFSVLLSSYLTTPYFIIKRFFI